MKLQLMIDLINANDDYFKKYNAANTANNDTARHALYELFNAYTAEVTADPRAMDRELHPDEIYQLVSLSAVLKSACTFEKMIATLVGIKEYGVYRSLHACKLLTREYFTGFFTHPFKDHLIVIINHLLSRFIPLTAAHLPRLLAHPNIAVLAGQVAELAAFYRLNPLTFSAILAAASPTQYVKDLVAQEKESIVTITQFYRPGNEANFKIACDKLQKHNLLGYQVQVLTHRAPVAVVIGLIRLVKAKLDTSYNIEVVFNHAKPSSAAELLCYLNKRHGVNTDRERQLVTQSKKPANLLSTLKMINGEYAYLGGDGARIPYAEIASYLLENKKVNMIVEIETVLRHLMLANLLTIANIQNALQHYGKLSQYKIRSSIFGRIPDHVLTQTVFDGILRVCATHTTKNLIPAIDAYVAEVLANVPAAPLNLNAAINQFNPAQSTHTSSVHLSVSKSAVQLNDTYGHFPFDERVVLNEMKDWLNTLSNQDPQIAAAKRGFNRLQHYHYVDERSKVSTTRLLALYWQAMHDHERCTVTFADARKRVLNTLYEIQREYNIKNNEEPDVMPDKPTCTSGAFNAIVAGGWGHHPMCHIVYVTKDAATLKLAKVALEVTQEYLTALLRHDPVKVAGYIKEIREQTCISPVWDFIKAIVADKIFEEFEEAFPLGKTNTEFTDMIDAGEYVAAPPAFFTKMEQQQNIVKMAAILAEGKLDGMSNLTKMPDTILIDIAAMAADAPLAHTKLAVSLAHHGFWSRANTVVKMVTNRVQKELDELMNEPELKRRKIA